MEGGQRQLRHAARLNFLIRVILSELLEDINILCVGAGNGLELIAPAQNFPRRQFPAIETAAPMVVICRRAEENGITSRCAFHEDYLGLTARLRLIRCGDLPSGLLNIR